MMVKTKIIINDSRKNVAIIIPGSRSLGLAARIATTTAHAGNNKQAMLLDVFRKQFSDNDQYVRLKLEEARIKSIKGKTAYIVQTLYPRQDSALVELLFLVDAAKRAGASRVIPVIPYMAYSRQDSVFLAGECIASDVVLKSLSVPQIITFDSHFNRGMKSFTRNGVRVKNISAFPLLVSKVKELSRGERIVFVAPDSSVKKSMKALAGKDDYVIIFEKKRDRRTGKIESTLLGIPPESSGWKTAVCVIMDDIITSGTTIAKAAEALRSRGHSGKIIAACTHGLFTADCERRLDNAGVSLIISTDTIRTSHSLVSVAPLVSAEIWK